MSTPVQKVIAAVGLHEPLSMRLHWAQDRNDVWAFPLKRRRPAGTSRSKTIQLDPQNKEQVTDQFCDALNEWLGQDDIDVELTVEGKARFGSIINELLDNAERHSDPQSQDGSWSCVAFMARRQEGDRMVYRCHMAFLSVGSTIAESLASAPAAISDDVKEYARRHQRNGQSGDTLATLFALQDGITRVHDAVKEERGGIGFQDVLSFVSNLGDANAEGRDPRLTIVSGQSCIRLRRPYLIGERNGHGQPRLLWCNESNSPDQAPDPEYVFDIEDRFAGTIVGLSFVLDPDFIRQSLNERDQPTGADEER
jgi:two-component sensor histidine kinase